MLKPILRTKSIGTKVTEEEYPQLDSKRQSIPC